MTALPHMPFFINDYHADTEHLSTLEHGAYCLLIMNYWRREGSLPADDKRLAAIAKMTIADWRKIKPTIEEFFTVEHGEDANALRWHHGRIEHELTRANAKSSKARASANARWQKDKNTVAMRSHSVGNANKTRQVKKKETIVSKEKMARATRLPDDWAPSSKTVEWAYKEYGFTRETLYQCLLQFRDYWCALGGARAKKLDWDRTFKNRCRDLGKVGREKSNGKKSMATIAMEMARENEDGDTIGDIGKGDGPVIDAPDEDNR